MVMQSAPPIAEDNSDLGIRRYLWTSTEVARALELGLFPPTRRMELIAGELIEKMTQNRPHGISLSKSLRVLEKAFGDTHYVSVQTPMAVDDENEPEPDLMVVIGSPDDYDSHPTADAVQLVMEVSDTTVRYDQITKAPLYARAGVVEYWVLILKSRTLEVRRDPITLPESSTGYDYRSLTLYRETDTVTPLHAPNAIIRVADLLPRLKATAKSD
ncbi:MAG TPA: Uma2 family endonuclease [Chthonomonadaceae bacterium]|nr:Uma2 family endonuclease [Chthonomonadaceae bacterium]